MAGRDTVKVGYDTDVTSHDKVTCIAHAAEVTPRHARLSYRSRGAASFSTSTTGVVINLT